ncbi:NETI motif-containing protein [Gracilibacillus sp. S3-1-1]|uniref:NETI motif-containing protein n=1 Tax=Gracilibacillus pellucidus TaxID=3095368 RepID=A0ACC6M7B7_9BACI|nr:NETI motif-containing protein [Gracilibacillus sp. S3-1-1]MDX8046786.1 NETI motif-containing protein [Gracilibacillus sp. S3-1-1]
MSNKKRFEVMENETIDACLDRIKGEGYQPVRRVEEPIFIEENGQPVPHSRKIIFDCKKINM